MAEPRKPGPIDTRYWWSKPDRDYIPWKRATLLTKIHRVAVCTLAAGAAIGPFYFAYQFYTVRARRLKFERENPNWREIVDKYEQRRGTNQKSTTAMAAGTTDEALLAVLRDAERAPYEERIGQQQKKAEQS